ncbi:MAG TPA: hypothetical protein VGL76_08445 [Gaiellaceae bacterium]
MANALPFAADEPGRWTKRFVLIYTTLGLIMAGAITGLILLVILPGYHHSAVWSSWKPDTSNVSKAITEITAHVAPTYRLGEDKGQLVALIATKPQVTSGTQNIAINAVAVRKAPQSNTGIQVYLDTSNMEQVTLCGLGAHCSIATGTPTQERGRLVRREALEVALYAFKFVPGLNSIATFLPPAPGQTTTNILYLRKTDLQDQLSRPLSTTLPLSTPPLPSAADSTEKTTIDKLTLPHLFTYELTALQAGGAALVLDPAS